MDDRAKAACVSIHRQGDAEPKGGGVLVRGNMIATCAHVVNQALGRDRESAERPGPDDRVEMRLTFPDDNTASEITRTMLCSVVFWKPLPERPSHDDDLALLEVDQPNTLNVFCDPNPPDNSPIDCWGFHRGDAEGAPITAVFVSQRGDGRLHCRGDNSGDGAFFEGGASGSGVFLRETNTFLGIVTGVYPQNRDREGLLIGAEFVEAAITALPGGQTDPGMAVDAAHASDWREYQPSEAALNEFQKTYQKLLCNELQDVTEAGWSRVKDQFPEFDRPYDTTKTVDAFVEHLLSNEPKSSRDGLSRLHNKLKDEGRDVDANVFLNSLFFLAPARPGDDALRFIAWKRDPENSTRYSIVSLGASVTMAELIAAAMDDAKADFMDRKRRAEMPSGRTRISDAPEGGLDPDCERELEAFCEFLSSRRDVDGFVDQVDSYLAQEFGVDLERPAGQTGRERLAAELEAYNDFSGDRSYYLVVPAASCLSDASKQRLLELAGRIVDLYPGIPIIAVDPTGVETEKRELASIRYSVPLKENDR